MSEMTENIHSGPSRLPNSTENATDEPQSQPQPQPPSATAATGNDAPTPGADSAGLPSGQPSSVDTAVPPSGVYTAAPQLTPINTAQTAPHTMPATFFTPQRTPQVAQHAAPQLRRQPQTNEPKTTLWMGELDPWLDEQKVQAIWQQLGESIQVKMIKERYTGANVGYCFIGFPTHEAAVRALQLNGCTFTSVMLNNLPLPNSQITFRLNWATGAGLGSTNNRSADGHVEREYSVFVGDLAPDVTEETLLQLFAAHFPSTKTVKILIDPSTGASRCYGFVRFTDESEQQRALIEMQGVYCGSRPMRVSAATPKTKGHSNPLRTPLMPPLPGVVPHSPLSGNASMVPYPFYQPEYISQYADPQNTTVFVGGLAPFVTEQELRGLFAPFGEICYVKIPQGKGCGFVQFVHRASAEAAIAGMHGAAIGNSRVRLSWGKSNRRYDRMMMPMMNMGYEYGS